MKIVPTFWLVLCGFPLFRLGVTMPAAPGEWRITLKNGNVFRGQRLSENQRLIVLLANGSPVSIFRNVIAHIDSGASFPQSREQGTSNPAMILPRSTEPPVEVSEPPAPAPRPRSTVHVMAAGSDGTPAKGAVLPAPAARVSRPAPPGTVPRGSSISVPVPRQTPPAPPATPRQERREENPPDRSTVDQAGALSPLHTHSSPSPCPLPRTNVISVSGEPQKMQNVDDDPWSAYSQIGGEKGTQPAAQLLPVAPFPVPRGATAEKTPEPFPEARSTPLPAPAISAAGEISVIPAPRRRTPVPSGSMVQPGSSGTPVYPERSASNDKVRHIAPLPVHPATAVPEKAGRNVAVPVLPGGVAPPQPPGQKAVLPAAPRIALPAGKPRRSDGRQELALMDGTVFIGTVSSETEHALVFYSEGASITILKRLIGEIDGVPYRYTLPVPDDRTPFSGSGQPPVGRDTAPERKSVAEGSFFRVLPQGGVPEGIAASELADSMKQLKDWRIRSRAVRALGAMGAWGAAEAPEAAALLSDTTGSAAAVPVWLDSSSAERLLAPALEAARALALLGAQGENHLLRACGDRNPIVRRSAIFGLGYSNDESSVKAVHTALRDPSPEVRRSALGSLRVATSFSRLLAGLDDPEPMVRAAAVELLGRSGNRTAVEHLEKLVKDGRTQVRRAVAEAFGTIGGPEAVAALSMLYGDPDNFVRAEAVRSLGKTRDGEAVTPLLKALKDRSAEVRAGAAEALGTLRDSKSIPSLYSALKDKSPLVREKAQFAVKQLTELPLLIAALDDESVTVRTNTAYVLWLMTGQDFGQDREKWRTWAEEKGIIISKTVSK